MRAMLFVITDAHSKWVDRQTFATLGLPKIIVGDNAAVFTDSEFQMLLSNNGIINRKSSPYHPPPQMVNQRG